MKLSPAGQLLWYYQLTPHDLFDWDLQDPPVLTTANGQPVVIDGGKAGILIELNAHTGKLIWKLPVGVHNGNDDGGALTEHATPTSHLALPARSPSSPAGSAASRPRWPATARPRSPRSTTSRSPKGLNPGPTSRPSRPSKRQ